MVALTTSPQFGLFIFQASTGSLLASYHEYNTVSSGVEATRTAAGVHISSTSQRIFTAANEGNYLYISAFDFDGGTSAQLTPVYYKRYGSTLTPYSGETTIATSGLDYVYVGGSIANDISLLKLQTSTGNANFAYSVTNTDGVSTQIKLAEMSIIESLTTCLQFLCAENLGPDQNDIAFLYYSETLGLVTSIV